VLVTLYDDRPVPKVIDFGVAKAVEQRLTDRTLFTQFGTLVGTFEYMSPEQAELNAFGVDTPTPCRRSPPPARPSRPGCSSRSAARSTGS
jgi:serine/threonine protein kinase